MHHPAYFLSHQSHEPYDVESNYFIHSEFDGFRYPIPTSDPFESLCIVLGGGSPKDSFGAKSPCLSQIFVILL